GTIRAGHGGQCNFELRSSGSRRRRSRPLARACRAVVELAGEAVIIMNRRGFLKGAAAGALALGSPLTVFSGTGDDLEPIRAEVKKRRDESIKRLQQWIHQPSIAAENRGMDEGCKLMLELLRDAGFGHAERVSTDGQPGVFAT